MRIKFVKTKKKREIRIGITFFNGELECRADLLESQRDPQLHTGTARIDPRGSMCLDTRPSNTSSVIGSKQAIRSCVAIPTNRGTWQQVSGPAVPHRATAEGATVTCLSPGTVMDVSTDA